MVLGIQVAGALFGLFMLYYSFLNYKRKEFTAKEFVFWVFVWVVFAVVALFPFILDFITIKFGFFRTLDVLVISGFLFLITAVFYTYTIVRKVQRKLETVVREIAIRKKK